MIVTAGNVRRARTRRISARVGRISRGDAHGLSDSHLEPQLVKARAVSGGLDGSQRPGTSYGRVFSPSRSPDAQATRHEPEGDGLPLGLVNGADQVRSTADSGRAKSR